jgi:hypothetical protein
MSADVRTKEGRDALRVMTGKWDHGHKLKAESALESALDFIEEQARTIERLRADLGDVARLLEAVINEGEPERAHYRVVTAARLAREALAATEGK